MAAKHVNIDRVGSFYADFKSVPIKIGQDKQK